jgi:class 3 adenylate cyclase
VNTASRLDGLSKRLNYKIIISGDVHECLKRDAQERFADLGKQSIRGRSQPIHVYGAVPRLTDGSKEQKDNVVSLSSKKSGNF